MQRGRIYNRPRARQLAEFAGLEFRSITPTDVDGLIDFGGRLFVLIEAKVEGTELPHGQEEALTRVCDALHRDGKKAALLIVEHDTEAGQSFNLGECQIVRERWRGKWYYPARGMTCREAIESLLEQNGLEYWLEPIDECNGE